MEQNKLDIAIWLKAWYITLRRVVDNPKFFSAERWNSVWLTLADQLKETEISPSMYMQAQFHTCTKVPFEIDTATAKATNKYMEYASKAYDYHKLTLSLQAHKVKSRMSYMKIRELLTDRDEELSALFRVCLASSKGYQDIINEFTQEAVEQYLLEMDIYNIVYEDIIPDEIKKAADREVLIAKAIATNSLTHKEEPYYGQDSDWS